MESNSFDGTFVPVIMETNVLFGVMKMKSLFYRSMENKDKIVVFYIDGKNNITQRFIKVININDDYITVYCYWRKQVRTFKLSNILSIGSNTKKRGA